MSDDARPDPTSPGPQARVVLCTCNERESLRLAHELVRDGLAACVNLVPKLTSVYVWNGEICEDRENLLVIKTTLELMPELRAALAALHPYEVPEVLALPVDEASSSRDYLSWLFGAVIPPGAAGERASSPGEPGDDELDDDEFEDDEPEDDEDRA
jgi:periplasmic divalent cation tolerance protein